MNINNFEWSEFRYSIHTFSWWEAAMMICFIIAGLVSLQWTKKTEVVDGKSVNALFFLLLGSAMGLGFKLFMYLNVTVFLYIALVVVFFLDYRATRKIRVSLLQKESSLKLKQRRASIMDASVGGTGRDALERDTQSSRRHSGEHVHSHGSHEHRHRHGHSRSHSSDHVSGDQSDSPKEPLYVDPLNDEK